MSNLSKRKSLNHHFYQWLIKAPIGLALIGFGVCLVSEAAMLKYDGVASQKWFWAGTLALVILNTGVCFVADATKHRSHYERLRASTP